MYCIANYASYHQVASNILEIAFIDFKTETARYDKTRNENITCFPYWEEQNNCLPRKFMHPSILSILTAVKASSAAKYFSLSFLFKYIIHVTSL